jgi:lysophospholipase L1-like esterase
MTSMVHLKRPTAIWGAVMMIAAPALFLTLVFLLRHQYGKELMAKIWPAGPLTVGVIGTTAPESRTVLLLGDSRMADWDLPEIKGWRVVNAGVRGATTAQLASCCRTILNQVQPQVVVIQAGINDLKLLGVRPDLGAAVVSHCVSNLLTIVAECRQAGARVVVTPVWPAGKVPLARRLVWSGAVDLAVTETNTRLLRLLATIDGVFVADLFSELTRGLSTEQRNRLYRDTLHLKPETYRRLSVLLAETIQARTDDPMETARPDGLNIPARP